MFNTLPNKFKIYNNNNSLIPLTGKQSFLPINLILAG